jgi:hypothetical protein
MTMQKTIDSSIRNLDGEYVRKHDAAQKRADDIADALTRTHGLKLNNRAGGIRDDLFYHLLKCPDLPDELFTHWLLRSYPLSAAERGRVWKQITAHFA